MRVYVCAHILILFLFTGLIPVYVDPYKIDACFRTLSKFKLKMPHILTKYGQA